MNVLEFEDAVWRIEEVLIRIRAPVHEEVGNYNFERRASGNMSVTNWMNGRLRPRLGNHQVSIVDGNFTHPHGGTKMRTLRGTYVAPHRE